MCVFTEENFVKKNSKTVAQCVRHTTVFEGYQISTVFTNLCAESIQPAHICCLSNALCLVRRKRTHIQSILVRLHVYCLVYVESRCHCRCRIAKSDQFNDACVRFTVVLIHCTLCCRFRSLCLLFSHSPLLVQLTLFPLHFLILGVQYVSIRCAMREAVKHRSIHITYTSVVAYSVFYTLTLNENFSMKLLCSSILFFVSQITENGHVQFAVCLQNRLASMSTILLFYDLSTFRRLNGLNSLRAFQILERALISITNWPTANLRVNLNLSSLQDSNGRSGSSCH